MSSSKRTLAESGLTRRVRARREASVEMSEIPAPSDASSAEETVDELSGSHSMEDETEGGADDQEDTEATSSALSTHDDPEAISISLGALAKAQANLQKPNDRKGNSGTGSSSRLPEDDTWENNEAVERKAGRKDHRDFNRSSKHAPTEMSSKKAVSRRREVMPPIKRNFRDPRFDPLSGPLDESKLKKAYSFLDDYRDDEMKELKAAIKSTKDSETRDTLKRALLSMESKKKAQVRRDKEQEILDQHRREEKEFVKQGKKPFYLKKAEQKKRMLLNQYEGLKGKQLDNVIERKRKKTDAKEKKRMPLSRRNTDWSSVG